MEGQGVLAGQAVSLAGPVSADVVVHLMSSEPAQLVLPSTVMIATGTTQAFFNLVVTDDALLNGPRRPIVTATAPGFNPASSSVLVTDNESTILRLALPEVLQEGGPPAPTTLSLGAAVTVPITVRLQVSDPVRVMAPPVIIMSAGQTNLSFLVRAMDDLTLNASPSVELSAEVPGWGSAAGAIRVLEKSPPALALALPPEAHESQDNWAGAGSVQLSSRLATNLPVRLESLDPSEIILPASIVIPAGEMQGTFDLRLIDDGVVNGRRPVTISPARTDSRARQTSCGCSMRSALSPRVVPNRFSWRATSP